MGIWKVGLSMEDEVDYMGMERGKEKVDVDVLGGDGGDGRKKLGKRSKGEDEVVRWVKGEKIEDGDMWMEGRGRYMEGVGEWV